MSEHTPGPWRPFQQQQQGDRLGWAVTTIDNKGPDITGWGSVTQTEANARLIAAAPDLLAACEKSLAWIRETVSLVASEWGVSPYDEDVALIGEIVTAIAKAKGGEDE